MFLSTQSDVSAARFGGFFSHSIDAIIDGGVITAAAEAKFRSNAAASSTEPNSAAAAFHSEKVFVRWHNWRGMKNWSICGDWKSAEGMIDDLRGMMIPQLAFLNKHVRLHVSTFRHQSLCI